MSIYNLGSLNVDHVYRVDHFVQPGETLTSSSYDMFAGGKGYNQSIALARAGARVFHIGLVGSDGRHMLDLLKQESVDTSHIQSSSHPAGHAVIQVTPNGENCILIHGGANQHISGETIQEGLTDATASDMLLLQNETSGLDTALSIAHHRDMYIAMNPAPYSPELKERSLEVVDLMILNETEACALADCRQPEEALEKLILLYPATAFVLTLGARGALYRDRAQQVRQDAVQVQPVDTTAAGDTFTGYFLAAWHTVRDPQAALDTACRAAASCITKPGAAVSIPRREELT